MYGSESITDQARTQLAFSLEQHNKAKNGEKNGERLLNHEKGELWMKYGLDYWIATNGTKISKLFCLYIVGDLDSIEIQESILDFLNRKVFRLF